MRIAGRHLMLLIPNLAAASAMPQAPVLERDITVGCEACGDSMQFSRVVELAASENGTFLVVSRDAPVLRLFDSRGRLIWHGGRTGRGPGEYQSILRAVLSLRGEIVIADAGALRVTSLGPDHIVRRTTPLSRFPTTAAVDGDGFVLGSDGPRGTRFDVVRVRNGEVVGVNLPAHSSGNGPAYRLPSLAVGPRGTIALAPNADRYVVVRFDSALTRLPDITRDIPRVARTPAEDSALRAVVGKEVGAVAEMAARRSGSPPGPVREAGAPDRSVKPHFMVDGLRYDPQGRLWVQTMRGDEEETIFDVFSASGDFAGSLTIPGSVTAFVLVGSWLFTGGENADGIPQVTRWTVR